MGGGGAMRAAAKVAGIGVMTGGIRSGATAEALAARKTVQPAPPEPTGSLRVEQAVQKPIWEIDDWEFAGGSDDHFVVDRVSPVKPRVVFGPVPSFEEAKEATSELKDAIDKKQPLYLYTIGVRSVYILPSQGPPRWNSTRVYLSPKSSSSVDSLSSSLQETKACITHESSVPKSAMQAFMLLKESSSAQTVVASIACDPNVWNAVMQNPALTEYIESERKLPDCEVPESPKSSTEVDDAGKPEGLMDIIEDVKRAVYDMVNSFSSFVQNLFADPDVGKKPESSEGTGRALFAGGSFMALAMMVIMVVVMKRG